MAKIHLKTKNCGKGWGDGDLLSYKKRRVGVKEYKITLAIGIHNIGKKNIPKITASVVGLPNMDIESCRKVAENLGVEFRVRTYYEEKYVE